MKKILFHVDHSKYFIERYPPVDRALSQMPYSVNVFYSVSLHLSQFTPQSGAFYTTLSFRDVPPFFFYEETAEQTKQ